jgi:hypothetical protein
MEPAPLVHPDQEPLMYNEAGPEFSPYANPMMAPMAALWAGVFAVMFCAAGSMIALTYRAR